MKCLVLIAALCCLGVCSGQGLDFLTDNILNPMVNQIYTNAVNLLGGHISSLFGNLLGTIGKRGVSDGKSLDLIQNLLAPFIGQIKEIYQSLFQVFLQIVQHTENWIQKPDWARMEFVRAGVVAEEKLKRVKVNIPALQPLLALVQNHLSTLITDFEGIIVQAMNAAKHPIQSLIGAGNLLQP